MEHDNDTGFIAIAALRYAMGRRTYAPETITEWVKRYWRTLSVNDQMVIRKDLQQEFEMHERSLEMGVPSVLGDDCDVVTWSNFRNWITENFGNGRQ